jgi:DNA (cytosine-5)-methyltransferase 1
MARLHGFPDWFRLHETKWHGARQVGNAVPVPLARAVATELMQAMGITPSRPSHTQKLGDDKLILMDMSVAAKHWGVPVPISQRDRKSGVTKRSQVETEAERILELVASGKM